MEVMELVFKGEDDNVQDLDAAIDDDDNDGGGGGGRKVDDAFRVPIFSLGEIALTSFLPDSFRTS
jgi:hypothetical protein